MNLDDRIAENLSRAIARDGRSPRAIALAAGLNHTAIRDILTRKTNSPRADTLRKLAAELGIPESDLTEGARPVDGNIAQLLAELTESERLKAEGYIRALLDSRPSNK